jgi:hypothetical protein
MNTKSIELVNGQLVITGYPDAIKVARLEGDRGRDLADLTLHLLDLHFAHDCLASINSVPPDQVVTRGALWLASIVRFFKCFGKSKSRAALEEVEICGGDPEAMACFNYFKSLRDKHLVHDENAMVQCKPIAIINRQGSVPRVADVVGLVMVHESLDQGHYDPFSTLVTSALTWVIAERDRLIAELSYELEREPLDRLMALPLVEFKKATADDIGKKR